MARALPFFVALLLMALTACDPAKDVAASKPDASLENTYWKLVRLGDTAIATPEGAREVQITFASEDRRVQGFAGCNHVNGAYTLDGESLRFGALATTRMACDKGMDTEASFLAALEATRGWKVQGDTLALTNADGATLARFEAVYLR